jgi:NADH-quinone oxidoreductase subunit C
MRNVITIDMFSIFFQVYRHFFKKIIFFNWNFKAFYLLNSSLLVFLSNFLKFDKWFSIAQLLDIFAVDYLGKRTKRFEVNYIFLSLRNNLRFCFKILLEQGEYLNSLMLSFASANWLEREIWDLYGIFFYNHGDLRRILTDYGFEAFPFRVDYPISGYFEIRFDELKKRIVSEPIRLSQEYRVFRFVNPWSF